MSEANVKRGTRGRSHNCSAVSSHTRVKKAHGMCWLRNFKRIAVTAVALVSAWPAAAQTWPERPLKFIVAAPAGSSLDVLARAIAEKLKDRLGQPVIVEDRPAAGGTVATDVVAKSPPEGYTMVISFNGPLAFGPHLYAKLPYDPSRDLAPVIITSSQPNVLAIYAALPVNSVKELIAYAKANPGKLNFASVGNGSSSHLTMELLKTTAGIDIVHVPFNGSPPAVTATIQGETQMLFAVMSPLQAQIQAGKLRALAVTTARRFPLLPDLPTVAEAGYPGFEALAWNGILVAAGTPRLIIARLNTEINAILKDPAVKSALNAQGFELIGGTPEDFGNLIRNESEKWAPVIKQTGARID
jgi:tripartite-type tricarboxylate transporter receptor subunit TctC